MELVITEAAKDDIRFFLKTGQTSVVRKIEKLLASVRDTPFSGIGKPEPLKHNYSGKWSRRIDNEHRLIYEVRDEIIYIYCQRTL